MLEYIPLLGLLAISFFTIMIFNRLVALRQIRENAFSDIDVQLKLRHDLIPGLVATVKKYTQHEQDVLENVTASRSQAMQARTIGDKSVAEAALDQSLMKLLSVTEAYPDLKADEAFVNFQDHFSAVEKSVTASRRFFNNATAEYNTAIQQFPANILAGVFKFNDADYFEVLADEKTELQKPASVEF